MKKGLDKKVFLFLIVGVLLVSLISFVVAGTVIGDIAGKFKLDVTSVKVLDEGIDFSQNIWLARILIFALVGLILYSIVEFLPFVSNNFYIKLGITLIIAFLSTFYLTKQEILTVLLSYGALGITLTAIIPFLAIAVVSKQLYDSENVQFRFFGKVIWLAFLIFLGFRWLFADASAIGDFGKWAYPIVFFASLAMFLWEKRLWFILFKQQVREYGDTIRNDRIASITAELERMADQIESTTNDAARKKIVGRYNKKADTLRTLGVNWRDWGR